MDPGSAGRELGVAAANAVSSLILLIIRCILTIKSAHKYLICIEYQFGLILAFPISILAN
jgi:hypothetical protein